MEHKSSKEPTWLPWREMFIEKHYVIRNSFPTRCIIASLVKYFCIQKLFSFFLWIWKKERWNEEREGGKEGKEEATLKEETAKHYEATVSTVAIKHENKKKSHHQLWTA